MVDLEEDEPLRLPEKELGERSDTGAYFPYLPPGGRGDRGGETVPDRLIDEEVLPEPLREG